MVGRRVGDARAAAEVGRNVEVDAQRRREPPHPFDRVELDFVAGDEAVVEGQERRAAAKDISRVVGDDAVRQHAVGRAAADEGAVAADDAVRDDAAEDAAAAVDRVAAEAAREREAGERAGRARDRQGEGGGARAGEQAVVRPLDDRRFGAGAALDVEDAVRGDDGRVGAGRNDERVAVLRRVDGVLERRAAAGDGRRVALEAGRHNMVGVDVGERERRARAGVLAVHEPAEEGASVRGGGDRGGATLGDDDGAGGDGAVAVHAHGDDVPFHFTLVAAEVGVTVDDARVAREVEAVVDVVEIHIAVVDAGRTGEEAEVAVLGVDEERVFDDGVAVQPLAVLAVGVRLVDAVALVVPEVVARAAVGRAVVAENGVEDRGVFDAAGEATAVVDDRAAAQFAEAGAATLGGGVVGDEAVVGFASVDAAAEGRAVVRDGAADQRRAKGAAAVGGDVVLEDAGDERATHRAAAALHVVRGDAPAVLERKARERGAVGEERAALRVAAVDDRRGRAGRAEDVHAPARRVDGRVGAGGDVDRLVVCR